MNHYVRRISKTVLKLEATNEVEGFFLKFWFQLVAYLLIVSWKCLTCFLREDTLKPG